MAVTAVIVAALAYLLVAWNSTYPNVALDEIVMVANSRVIAGLPATWELQGWGFSPGLAVLMAPAWWLSDDPVIVYRVGIAISAALGVLAIWPLSSIARRVGASPTAAVVIASAVVVAPARLLLANYLFSEALLVLVTAATVVAAARMAERPTLARGLLLGVLTGACILAHLRGAALAIGVGLWGLTMLRRALWPILAAGLSATLVGAASYGLYVWVTAQVFSSDDERVSSTFAGAVGRDAADVVASVLGQSWYAVFAWAGMTIVGALWSARRFVNDPLARLVVLAAASSLVLSTIGLNARTGVSFSDVWYYGRYNDQVWALLAVVGIAVIQRIRWLPVSLVTVLVATLAGVLMMVVVVPHIGVIGTTWSEFNTYGISPWLNIDRYSAGQPQLWARLCVASVLLTVLAVAAGWWRGAIAPLLLVFWVTVAVWHDGVFLDVVAARSAYVPAGTPLWDVLPEGTTVGVDKGLAQDGNVFIFYSEPHVIEPVDLDDVPSDVDVVYAGALAKQPVADGAMVLDVWRGLFVMWVYPGDVYDQLDAEGLLVDPETVIQPFSGGQ